MSKGVRIHGYFLQLKGAREQKVWRTLVQMNAICHTVNKQVQKKCKYEREKDTGRIKIYMSILNI